MDFLDSPEWKDLSIKIRNRDKRCLRCGSNNNLCADHIIPRRYNKKFQLEEFNLQTLCWNCNDQKSFKYIVYFGTQKNPRVEQEIENLKKKFYRKFKNFYAKQLTINNHYRSIRRKRANPSKLDKVENTFNSIMSIPENSKNPLIKTASFIARFASIPVTMPAYGLLLLAQSLDEPSINSEASDLASAAVEKIFNNWE